MRIVYMIVSLVGMLGGALQIAAGQVFAGVFSILVASVVFSLIGIVDRLEALVDRVARFEEDGQDAKAPPSRSTAPTAGPAIDTSAEEVRALLASAQEDHFSKRFDEARETYRDIVARFPESKQAHVARQQLVNLKRA